MNAGAIRRCAWSWRAVSAAALLFASSPAAAATLLGTDNVFVGAEPAIESTQSVAQAFTLTQSISLSSIDVGAGSGPHTEPLLVQLTNSLGPGTSVLNVVFSDSVPGSSVPSGITSLLSVPASLTLGPGTYYLVLSIPGATLDDYTWSLANNVLPSSVGTVGQGLYCCFPNPVGSFPPAETFNPLTLLGSQPPQFYFALEGEAVPEPSTLLLVVSGLGATLSLRRRGLGALATLRSRPSGRSLS